MFWVVISHLTLLSMQVRHEVFYWDILYIYMFLYIQGEREREGGSCLKENDWKLRKETASISVASFQQFGLVLKKGCWEKERGEKKNIVAQEVNIYKGRSKKKQFVCLLAWSFWLCLHIKFQTKWKLESKTCVLT